MKKILLAILSVLLLFSVAGCMGSASYEGKTEITLIFDKEYDGLEISSSPASTEKKSSKEYYITKDNTNALDVVITADGYGVEIMHFTQTQLASPVTKNVTLSVFEYSYAIKINNVSADSDITIYLGEEEFTPIYDANSKCFIVTTQTKASIITAELDGYAFLPASVTFKGSVATATLSGLSSTSDNAYIFIADTTASEYSQIDYLYVENISGSYPECKSIEKVGYYYTVNKNDTYKVTQDNAVTDIILPQDLSSGKYELVGSRVSKYTLSKSDFLKNNYASINNNGVDLNEWSDKTITADFYVGQKLVVNNSEENKVYTVTQEDYDTKSLNITLDTVTDVEQDIESKDITFVYYYENGDRIINSTDLQGLTMYYGGGNLALSVSGNKVTGLDYFHINEDGTNTYSVKSTPGYNDVQNALYIGEEEIKVYLTKINTYSFTITYTDINGDEHAVAGDYSVDGTTGTLASGDAITFNTTDCKVLSGSVTLTDGEQISFYLPIIKDKLEEIDGVYTGSVKASKKETITIDLQVDGEYENMWVNGFIQNDTGYYTRSIAVEDILNGLVVDVGVSGYESDNHYSYTISLQEIKDSLASGDPIVVQITISQGGDDF